MKPIVGFVALAIPLLVTVVVCEVVRREGVPAPWRQLWRLIFATIVAIAASPWFPHPLVVAPVALILFGAFAIPVTRALERSARARLTHEDVRTASLIPRTAGMYLPVWLRTLSVLANVVALWWVVERARATASPLLMLFGFAFAGVTFFALYEAWLRQEVVSSRARDEQDRRQRVRAIFAAQNALSLSLLVMAALSAGTWPGLPTLGVTAGIIGAIGCALALSTGVQQRYLQAAGRN